MRGPIPKITLLLCVFVLGALSLQAQRNSKASEQSCFRFVQDFYNWYAANVFKDFKAKNRWVPWRAAMKYKGNPFSSELTKALIDSDAEAETDRDPVLDFDPILNSQDPANRYMVRSVTLKDGHYWANIYGVWRRPVPDQGGEPQVVAEISFESGRWLFVNFHYPNSTNPDNENLLSILRYQYQPRKPKLGRSPTTAILLKSRSRLESHGVHSAGRPHEHIQVQLAVNKFFVSSAADHATSERVNGQRKKPGDLRSLSSQ